MVIDTRAYAAACACGQVHSVATRLAIMEAGCMQELNDRLKSVGLTGRRAAIYDTNTYQAAGLHRPQVDQEVILEAEGLCADEDAVACVLRQLTNDTQVLIAIGAGTIHDIVRYCAHRLGLPFVACPTAASVDGYATTMCAMTWQGTQVLLPGVAPVLVLADLEIIGRAPAALTRAGVGEALAKFTALADWRIAGVLTGQEGCPVVESLLRQAAVAAHGCCADLQHGTPGAYAQLMYALILPGIAVQMQEDAYAATAAEHMLSDLMDRVPAYAPAQRTLHGEQVGVCTVAVSALYHKLARLESLAPLMRPYQPLDEALADLADEALLSVLIKTNTPDCLMKVGRERLVGAWEDIRRIVAELPTPDALMAMLTAAGAKSTMEELGICSSMLPQMLKIAPFLRNQLTLARVARLIKPRYGNSADASRASSRKSRYADKAITRAGNSSAVSASSMR